jgi:hypothetical protein
MKEEELTPKQIFTQKFIAVIFTLALFVLMVWGILRVAEWLMPPA